MNTHRNRTRARLMRGWWDEHDRLMKDKNADLGHFQYMVNHMQDLYAPKLNQCRQARRKLYWRNPVGCTQPNIKACLRGCVGVCEAKEEALELAEEIKSGVRV